MKVIDDILLTNENFKNSYIAIGAFDGIHLGHRELILDTVKKAKEKNGKSVVFTFSNHPLEITKTKQLPKLINSLDEKIHIIKSLGVDYLILQPFTEEFSNLSPTDFLEKILINILDVKGIFVGTNFAFGKKGEGKADNLKKIANSHNIEINIKELLTIDNQVISSTYIREKLENGELDIANKFLGKPFLIAGEVIHGKKLGRVLGFPTANLEILNKVYPPFGIYGGTAQIEGDDNILDVVVNIGRNPTLKSGEKSIEVHILNFNEDIYGKKIYVSLLEFLRDEKKFNSIDELKETIQNDVLYWKKKVGI